MLDVKLIPRSLVSSSITIDSAHASVNVIPWLFLVGLFLGTSQLATAQSVSYDNNGLKIELSDGVQTAIDSGVSITFESEFAHTDSFFFIHWRKELERHEFVVKRHILSNRYLVQEPNRLEPNIFSSTRETMAYISETTLSKFAKFHSKQVDNNADHQMRLRLSKTKLPGPMRLTAFFASDWDIDSGWSSWQSGQ